MGASTASGTTPPALGRRDGRGGQGGGERAAQRGRGGALPLQTRTSKGVVFWNVNLKPEAASAVDPRGDADVGPHKKDVGVAEGELDERRSSGGEVTLHRELRTGTDRERSAGASQ